MTPPSAAIALPPADAVGLPDAPDLPCAVASIRADGRVLDLNPALCSLLGRSADSLRGRPFDDLLSVAGAVVYQSYLMPLLRLHGHLQEFAISLRNAAGQPVDVLLYAGSRDVAGLRVHDLVLVPIRQRRRVEEEMLRIKRAADESPDMIFQLMCLPGGPSHFPYVSEAVRTLYGSTPQEAQASADAVFGRVLDADRAALLLARDAAATAGQPWRATARVRTHDGGIAWHEFSASPRQLANGVTLWHGHVANVTQRRAMEQAAADREAAHQASRAKSEFLARVSHELRTPLNGILGFAQLLATQDADNLHDEQRRRLAVLQTAGQGLLHLINDVLDITSIEMGQLSLHLVAQPLDAAIDQALAVAEPQALAAGVALLRPPPSGLQVRADPRRLQQVLGNLLSNAIKYNRPGGRVVVHAGLQAAGQAGGRVCIGVQDTGFGMDAGQVARLFEPFNRLGAERAGVEGTGLGLAITRQLVQHMGGEITVDSAPGVGSRFDVWLPVADQPAWRDRPITGDAGGPSPPLPTDAAPVPWQGPLHRPQPRPAPQPVVQSRVLYVEDNPVNAMLMEAIVGLRPGLCLQVCTTAAQGLAAALADPPALLLLDMQLPDGDGCSLLRRLRTHPALVAVPALAVSAAARSDDLQQARDAGFAAYWTKPLAVDEVLAGLDRLLGPAATSGLPGAAGASGMSGPSPA